MSGVMPDYGILRVNTARRKRPDRRNTGHISGIDHWWNRGIGAVKIYLGKDPVTYQRNIQRLQRFSKMPWNSARHPSTYRTGTQISLPNPRLLPYTAHPSGRSAVGGRANSPTEEPLGKDAVQVRAFRSRDCDITTPRTGRRGRSAPAFRRVPFPPSRPSTQAHLVNS